MVYEFSCGKCNVTYYSHGSIIQTVRKFVCYSKTERHINIRSGEHIGISHLTEIKVECKPFAVSDHLFLQNHDRYFNDFTILCQDSNNFRLLLERIYLNM